MRTLALIALVASFDALAASTTEVFGIRLDAPPTVPRCELVRNPEPLYLPVGDLCWYPFMYSPEEVVTSRFAMVNFLFSDDAKPGYLPREVAGYMSYGQIVAIMLPTDSAEAALESSRAVTAKFGKPNFVSPDVSDHGASKSVTTWNLPDGTHVLFKFNRSEGRGVIQFSSVNLQELRKEDRKNAQENRRRGMQM